MADKTISEVGENGRTAALENVQRLDGHLIMQGVGNGRGWSVVIDEGSGKLSAAVAGDRVAFVVFGACTPQ